MKKNLLLSLMLFIGFFGFTLPFCIAQIAKKEPIQLQKNDTVSVISIQSNKLPDRTNLMRLNSNEFNFNNKQKINIDSNRHWYALEKIDDVVYWNNVDCKKIIIEFKKNISIEDISVKNFLQKVSLEKILEKTMFPEIQNFYVFEVPNGSKSKIISIVQTAKDYDFILYAEPTAIFKSNACQPNDPYYNQQWGPYVMYADSVWCYFTGGSKNWLAVIDNAIDWYHEDLYDAVWYGYDFAMNDVDPTPDNGQEHGTHVTGIVGATINNGIGVAGMLVDTIYFAKVTDNTSTFSNTGIVNALNSIASNSKIRVINMSFGALSPNSAIETALQNAYNNGKLLIAAAGNNASSDPMYPAAYTIVISVSAVGVDAGGNLTDASYSNYGNTIDVSAPGGEISTGYPIISTLPSNNYGGANWVGTSMASPYVTGVAGMVFAVNPLLTNVQARTIIEQQVFDLGSPGWDILFGSGMVCAWWAFEEACNQLSITISASGSTTFCTGGSVALNAVYNSGISYQWQKNGVNISGATSNSYTVTQSGTYSLQIKTLGGVCQTNSNSIVITVNSVPANAGTISGTTTVCQGQSSVTYTVPTITYANSYVWTLPSGATGSSSTNSITVNYSTSAVSGNITVKGNNTCGDGATSSLSITVNSKPPTPIISLNGYVLHSDATNGNQWYDQTGFLNGATNQDYTVSVNGDYYVIVTLLGCSSEPSNTINVVMTGIEVMDNDRTIKIYPNPVSNELIIEIKGNNGKLNFDILNSIGQVIFKGNLVEKTTVQTSNFAPGVYLIKLENGKTFEFKKIIKE